MIYISFMDLLPESVGSIGFQRANIMVDLFTLYPSNCVVTALRSISWALFFLELSIILSPNRKIS